MERLENQDLNKIIVQGPIVRKFANGIATNFTIKTPRLSMPNVAKEGDVCYNYPEISFYGSEKDVINSNYKEGDVVRIEGMIQTQKKTAKDTGREFYDQKIIGLSIEESKKELAVFGYTGGAYVEAENKVYLKGTVSKIASPARGVLTINIRTFYNGRVNNIQTFLYERNVGNYMEEFRVGDKVCAVGNIQTLKKESADGDRYYRNIVINSICKFNLIEA
ncbi:single-stranded DNA-binding protein [Lacrimispora amygdalina]|uniref:single-stranded DNA-binding protein n=1 Tax=Lacrimispora amygdalina TaxID=253257 RepID=UPI000BE35AAC|nr:single-stranded DNA-binding protein [Lacrimispora amygdalina]